MARIFRRKPQDADAPLNELERAALDRLRAELSTRTAVSSGILFAPDVPAVDADAALDRLMHLGYVAVQRSSDRPGDALVTRGMRLADGRSGWS